MATLPLLFLKWPFVAKAFKFSQRPFFYILLALGDLDGAKEVLSKMKYYVTNSEMLHPLLPDE